MLIIPSKVIYDFFPKVKENEKEGKQRQEERGLKKKGNKSFQVEVEAT